jgi:hypothetical protein
MSQQKYIDASTKTNFISYELLVISVPILLLIVNWKKDDVVLFDTKMQRKRRHPAKANIFLRSFNPKLVKLKPLSAD